MKIIGIVGGIASGKSAVAEAFRALGAKVLDADKLGHEVLNEPDVLKSIRKKWGDDTILSDGTANRKAIAKIVFSQDAQGAKDLEYLESITHPRIRERLIAELETLRQERAKLVILDAALLLEAGWSTFCDEILFIEVPDSVRSARAQLRGWDAKELEKRESTQWDLAQKRSAATASISNDGTLETLTEKVENFWNLWCD